MLTKMMVRENEEQAAYEPTDPAEDKDFDATKLDRGDVIAEDEVPSTETVVEDEAPSAKAEEPSTEDKGDEVKEEAKEEPAAETKEEPKEEAKDETPEGLKPDHKIPKSRFDEVNGKLKDAKREIAELRAKLTPPAAEPAAPTAFDFEAKEREYMQLVVDGEHDQALAVRNEIRNAEKATVLEEASKVSREQVGKVDSKKEFDAEVAALNTRFPVFDPDSEVFNEELVEDAVAAYAGFLGKGMSPAKAMRKAAEMVAKANGLEDATAQKEEPKKEAPPASAKKLEPDVPSKVAASKKQPPKMAAPSAAPPERKLERDDLTDEEFDALPEATKKRLRGDIVA